MKIPTRRNIIILAFLTSIILVPVAGQTLFTPITGNSTVTIAEPLTVTGAIMPGGTCTTSVSTWSCTGTLFAGATGQIDVAVMNSGPVDLVVTSKQNSSNPFVITSLVAPVTIAAGKTAVVNFIITVSPNAPPGTATLKGDISR